MYPRSDQTLKHGENTTFVLDVDPNPDLLNFWIEFACLTSLRALELYELCVAVSPDEVMDVDHLPCDVNKM